MGCSDYHYYTYSDEGPSARRTACRSLLTVIVQNTFAQQMVIGPTIWAAKAAILALYVRLFGTIRWLRLSSYGLIVFMFLFYWSMVVISSVYCTPKPGAPWNAVVFARCETPMALNVVVVGVLDVATDLVLYILPFPIINNLQLTKRRRIGLRAVFLVGFM